MLDQNPFGPEYEKRLISTMVADRRFCYAWLSIFDEKYLISKYAKWSLHIIGAVREKYGRPPDKLEFEVLAQELVAKEIQGNDLASTELGIFYREISEYYGGISVESQEFVKDHALKYVKQRALQLAILECAALIGTPREPEMESIISKAQAVGTDQTNFGLDYFEERRERALRRYSVGWDHNRIPFLIPKLDDSLGGVGYRKDGVGIPELFVFAGGANVGKSRWILHMAKVAVALGHNAIIHSSEMHQDLYADRMDMSFGLLTTAELYDPLNYVKLQRRIEQFANQGAKLFIKKWTAGAHTIRDANRITKLIEDTLGIDFSLQCWDYSREFKAEGKHQKTQDGIAEVMRSHKGSCDEFESAGIGAIQLTRGGANEERPGLDALAEDLTAARVGDGVAVISQTEEQYNMDPPEHLLTIRKSRAGEKNQSVRIFDDRKRMRMMQHPAEC